MSSAQELGWAHDSLIECMGHSYDHQDARRERAKKKRAERTDRLRRLYKETEARFGMRIPTGAAVHAWLYHGANHLGEGGEPCEAHDLWSDQKHEVDKERWKVFLIAMDACPEDGMAL